MTLIAKENPRLILPTSRNILYIMRFSLMKTISTKPFESNQYACCSADRGGFLFTQLNFIGIRFDTTQGIMEV
ncbi:CLUMA_CG000602, isoform A [Clunio marinus]|uniref:CLUMA_CG000602, isoform A n=1 Tax=Clunio marinus TaxID=568069 RepID=A0A1J1HGT7_9DIPT|nr:CLUMA_CG000602, isoform A [Clunio marinus]